MYKEYYKLNTSPFQMSPDPRFFFASKGHKRALSYLQYGLSQGEGFIVITGDIGTGKTTIVKNLLSHLDPKTFIAKQLVTTHLEEHDLIEMICESFELMSKGLSKAAMLNQFNAFLKSAHKLGRRVLLVVDEVQNLPARTVEELRMLSNFQIDNKPLIQSFLVGQREFIETIQGSSMEQLRQRVIASCHLGPLSAEETKKYIQYRLAESGWKGKDLFSDPAYILVYELTEGVPRRINVFCDRVLLFGYLEEVSFFEANHIQEVAEELGKEITSPVKNQNQTASHMAVSGLQGTIDHSDEVMKKIDENSEIPTLDKEKAALDKTKAASSESISETLKAFEKKIGQEISDFKKSLGKNF